MLCDIFRGMIAIVVVSVFFYIVCILGGRNGYVYLHAV